MLHAPLIRATAGLELSAIVTSQPERRSAARAAYPEAAVLADARAVPMPVDPADANPDDSPRSGP